ncbi:uncharacterized protein I206_103999 [Kwoniella pini CBS 10737]|uniref:Uncharacterized protein n=1 Tax=Kwoniella pini CBS 10737 TaxID=1296096 RepID=A0A1B9I2Y2_9TREE|nr:uncharacterized protein I206_04427 [Kwoniella pini CBS 10737]OCF49897.1 hypothetical protein I206_04427 [Kwoniella pini CBS 10737]
MLNPSLFKILNILLLSFIPHASASPILRDLQNRAEEDDEEGWIDSVKNTSDDWCSDNPELCSTSVVAPLLIVTTFILLYFCYYKPRKNRKVLQELERQKQNNDEEKKKQELTDSIKNKTTVGLMKNIFSSKD